MLEQNCQIGYSQKINDPAFAKYIKDTYLWSGYFSLGLAFFAVLGFYIYGESSSEIENPGALYIGLGVGSMFILIALFQIVSRNKSKTWDGIIVNKQAKSKRKRSQNDDDWIDYIEYIVSICDDNEKMHLIKAENDDTQYNYYKIGDKIRCHKGLNSFEKHDKSGDTIIFCNACASLNDIHEQYFLR